MTINWKLGLGFSVVTAVMWGLLPLALKRVLEAMDPVTISWYRFSVSAAIALLWFGLTRGRELQRMLFTRHLPLSLVVITGLIGNYLLYIWGLEYINPAAQQILIQVAPLLLLGSSVVIFKERLSLLQWLGVMGLVTGLVLFFHLRINKSVFTSESYLGGVGLTLAAAVVWSVYGLAQKQLLSNFHAKDILLLICLAGSLLLWPFANPAQLLELNLTEAVLLAFCGLNTIIAYGCFGLAMSHWQASRVSAVLTLVPLLTLLFTLLLNRVKAGIIPAEPTDWLSYLGAALVVAGAAVAALSSRKQ